MLQLREVFWDPVLVGLALFLLVVAFLLYLLARRTLLGMREGYRQGRRRD